MKIGELVKDYPSIALVGMCKNAGKTTVLNRLIGELHSYKNSLAVTSIGRDGESADVVTGTDKPPVFIYEGMLAATAEQLLPLCDVTREILVLTDMNTPLGRVVLFKARSDGYIQIAGPSSTEQMTQLRRQFLECGAEMTIIDGALSRRTPAACVQDGAVILSAGAAYDRDVDIVVRDTAFVCHILTLPAVETDLTDAFYQQGRCMTLGNDGKLRDAGGSSELLKLLKSGGIRAVRFDGALTGGIIETVLGAGDALDGICFIVKDSSKVLLDRETYEKLRRRGGDIRVERRTKAAAVTVNPVSPDGWHFDRDAFIDAMRAAVKIPVIDVEARL